MPYANVTTHLNGNGLRLQWSKGGTGHVQAVAAPMVGGMPEENFLATDEAKWVDLNRQSINDLIRHLRQARDDAFGKDE